MPTTAERYRLLAVADGQGPAFNAEPHMERLRDWLIQNAPETNPVTSPFSAAFGHVAMHGVRTRNQDAQGAWLDDPRCDDWPCKPAGVSFAIFELVAYARESTRPGARLVCELESLARSLDSIVRDHALRIEQCASEEQQILINAVQIWGKERVDADGHARFTDGPLKVVEELKELQQHVRQIGGAARSHLQLLHRCLIPPPKRGRPLDAPLIVATQQLRIVGGFTFPEIADLIRDGQGGTVEISAERARRRMEHPDMREIFTATELCG